jgi:uncharacterized protein involved in exopolysaccharide biosynthesis
LKADERNFSEYLSMIRRRWVVAAGAGGLIFLGFVLYAYIATPIFEATATIFVERPLIPEAAVATYPDDQLAAVTQRVLSTPNVSSIISKFDLYPAARESARIEDLVAAFRSNTVVTPSVADTSSARGRTATMTYAFTVAFRYADAEKASMIANELARQHVAENSALRSGCRSTETWRRSKPPCARPARARTSSRRKPCKRPATAPS